MSVPSGATLARLVTQLGHIEADSGDGTLALARGTALHVSHLSKVLFPDADVTKGDLMRYYAQVAPFLLPLLADRPLALKRFPNGITGEFFFQQKAPPDPPPGVRVEHVETEDGSDQARLIGGTLATLLYCVQLGAFECNPWHARVGSLGHPDYAIIDLDPGPDAPFTRVIETALWVKEELDRRGLHGAVKTSGATGIHIYLPLPRTATDADAERGTEAVARAVVAAHPRETTVERAIRARGDRTVYVDYGQNARGKTVAAAYSVRAKPGATVSTPLRWDELTPTLDPRAFTIRTLAERLEQTGDLWRPALARRNAAALI